MRKIQFLLLALLCNLLLQAQTTPSVNFTTTHEPGSIKFVFNNTSQNLGEGVKKAYWSFGDGTSVATGALDGTTHYYTVAATYQVCLKIYRYPANSHDSVLIGSECKSVMIEQACTAGFQSLDSVPRGTQIHYTKFFATAQSNAGKVIKQVCWKFGDGTDTCVTVTSATPASSFLTMVHKYKEGSTYNVCLRVVFDGGCVAEKCGVVNVTPPPTTNADSCAAHYATHTITASALGRKFIAQPWHNRQRKPLRICWNFGDGKDTCIAYNTAYAGDYWVEHVYPKAGEYEACVSIKYDGGCESRWCDKIKIEGPSTPPPPPPATCEAAIYEVAANMATPERKFYVGLQANKTAEKICWNFGDGSDTCIALSTPLNPQQLIVSHRYAAPGAYAVCIRVVYAGGCVAERCRKVEIRMPQNNICGGYITDSVFTANTVRFKAVSIHNPADAVTGYLWTFGDGTSANEEQVKHVYAAVGKYTVCVAIQTASGCETKICKPVVIAGEVKPQLVLTPNPVVSTLTATFQSILQQAVSIKIYGGNGLLLKSYSRNAVAGSNTWNFDLSSLHTGVYSMIVQSNNQFATAIFFKQ